MKLRGNILATVLMAGSMALTPVAMLAQTPGATPMVSPMASPVTCPTESGMKVIGVKTMPNGTMVDNTLVGGLSGIDYDPSTKGYYVLSDDRSDEAPARFYNASFDFTSKGFNGVTLDTQHTLLQKDGQPYPNKDRGGNIPDPESIRVDPKDPKQIFWTSEGSQKLTINPFVGVVDPNGTFVNQLPLPKQFEMSKDGTTGPRDNLVFEGMTFSADGESLWVSMEGPMFQDADVATHQQGSLSRITNMDRNGNVLGEYAYELDQLPADPGKLFGTTGVTEILAVDDHRFLTIERATVQNAKEEYINYIKVYLIDVAGATDIKDMDALKGENVTSVKKTLVFDFNACGVSPIDNFEGMTWGPELDNGNRSLVMIADNNFNETQITEFVVFDVKGF